MPLTPVPALPDTARITSYAIVAQAGPFNVNFQIYGDESDYAQWVEVWLNGVQLTPIAQWSLSSPSGTLASVQRPIIDAQVTLVLASTGTLTIVGAQRPRRLVSYQESAPVTAHDVNLYENATRAVEREAWDGRSRVLRVAPGETLAMLPPLALRANQQAFFDALGNLTPGVIAPPAVAISAAVAAILNSATLKIFRDSLNVRRVLDVTQFGAIADGATDCQAAFALAYAAALPGEQIWIPAGAGQYFLSGGVPQLTKSVEWVLEQGANLSLLACQRAFTDLNIPANYPQDARFGHSELLSALPPKHGRYISFTVLNDGVVAADYESIGLFVITIQKDPLDGMIHDAVGVSPRCYVNVNGGRGYADHIVALGQEGINLCGLIGFEVDVTNPSTGTEPAGYDTWQKIGGAFYATGPKRGTFAIEIGQAASKWFYGLHINAGAIDPTGHAFLYENKAALREDGAFICGGKDLTNRQVEGVELRETGSIWSSTTGSANTMIMTKTGTPGAGVVAQIIGQQNDSGGNPTNFITMEFAADDATNGSEDSSISVSGLRAGAGVVMFTANSNFLGPGTDNTFKFGDASHRVTELFSVNNVINTSDEREKDNIAPLTDQVLDAWAEVSAQFFQWRTAIAEKGVDGARIHAGWIAQSVVAAFEAKGLDAWRYAAICKDPIMVTVKEKRSGQRRKMERREVDRVVLERAGAQMVRKVVKEFIDVPVVERVPVIDENGEPVMEDIRTQQYGPDGMALMDFVEMPDGSTRSKPSIKSVPRQMMHEIPVMEDFEEEIDVVKESGEYRLGLRVEQCLVLETALLRRRIERMEAAAAPGGAPATEA